MKTRLDQALVGRKLVTTRSQAENVIRLGKVRVNGEEIAKPGYFVGENDDIQLVNAEQYVSRAGLKLASVSEVFGLNFKGKTVLDVGSSTGGFTDYVLQHGAKKVIAVDVGTNQLHPKLRTDNRVELHEQTDIRNYLKLYKKNHFDIVLIDVSFISLREILPSVSKIATKDTKIIAMVKPQFEAGKKAINKGVIKNDTLRRTILKDFETWVKQVFVIKNKADSAVAGTHGNLERFYELKVTNNR